MPESKLEIIPVERLENKIIVLRNQRVMLDSDLAEIYGTETKVLNQAVKRNANRFPEDFMFKLTAKEGEDLRSQFVTSKMGRGGLRYLPYAFTEHGAVMLASVLNSPTAVKASILVVRAFIQLRRLSGLNANLAIKIAELENKYGKHDKAIQKIIKTLLTLIELPPPEKPREPIGFHP